MHAPSPATRSPLWIALGIALALMIGVVTAYLLGAFGLGPDGDAAEAARGEGLFSGTLNPILSFLSLIALLITLQLQRAQMRMQRQELDNSRAELEVTRTELASAQSRSALALAEQSGFLARQTFENTLFQLIRLHHQVVDGIDFRTGEAVTTKGRDCFRIYYTRRLRNAYQAVLDDEAGPRDALGRARAAYEAFYARNGHEVGHYFTNLFRIYKFIDGSPSGDREGYAEIVRAQLSTYELGLLFYNGLSRQGAPFKALLERYAVFEDLPADLPFDLGDLKLYDRAAYGVNAANHLD